MHDSLMFVVTGAAATGRRLWKSSEGSFGTVVDQQGIHYSYMANIARYAKY